MLVLPDADIDMAADAAVSARLRLGRASGAWRSRRSSPWATSRDPLVEAIKARLPKVKVGPGTRPDRRDGPARHAASTATRWPSYLDSGAAQGATVVADGREHPLYRESTGSSWARR